MSNARSSTVSDFSQRLICPKGQSGDRNNNGRDSNVYPEIVAIHFYCSKTASGKGTPKSELLLAPTEPSILYDVI